NESYAFAYDEQHRLKVKVNNQSAKKGIQYFYSPGGKLLKHINVDNVAVHYAYDDAGRLTGIQGTRADSIQYVYETSGRLKYALYPNGIKTQYAYNRDGSINRIYFKRQQADKPEKIISQLIYEYDEHGQLTRKTHQIPNNKTITDFYSYDGLGRLVKVEGTDNKLKNQLSYDPFGNRRYFATAKEKHVYTHNVLHQVLKMHKGSTDGELIRQFAYDKNGNLIEKKYGEKRLTFTYNTLDQLVKASFEGQWLAHYLYDYAGQRVTRVVPTTSERGYDVDRYFYSGGQIHGVYNQAWQPKGFYAYAGLDQPEMRISANNTHFLHQDALGSVVAYTDVKGELDSWAAYEPWGDIHKESDPVNSIFGFAGREPENTGLIYFRNRYYDPEIGRFTQADPMGFVDGANRYAYVMNNPVMNVDPWGTWTKGAATNMTGWDYYGSSAKLINQARANISKNASTYFWSEEWAYSKSKGPYPENTNKCNLFVHDVLKESGVNMSNVNGGVLFNWFGIGRPKYPILAGQWADENYKIKKWKVVTNAQPGDVVAIAKDYWDATGHVGIVYRTKDGKLETMSATANKIISSEFGFRKKENAVFRRYIGNEN
ncbi:hypothetical protein H0A36_27995, partial [Endozoicomonas sp. SM1973]